MSEIITDLEKLIDASEPIKLLSEDGKTEDEARSIMDALTEAFSANTTINALTAAQIGINKRLFGIRFEDGIKYFINPIITRKVGQQIVAETFASMPGKEILIGRPNEITAVYYTKDFKYEDNKLTGFAAAVFDQMCQMLDGVTPNELGLVSDIEKDGKVSDMTEEEFSQAIEIWKQFIKTKFDSVTKEIEQDENLKKLYNAMRFDESVINGRTQVVADDVTKPTNRAQRRLDAKLAKKAARKAEKESV